MMRRPGFILLLLWLPFLLAAPAFGENEPSRPNVLFLFTDDQRFDTIAALGNEHIRTPHLDRLVGRGVAFTHAYIMGGSSPAVCSPSRAMLMTGRTLWDIECQGLWGFEISEKRKTFPQVFREAGYTTWATGKNEPGKSGAFVRSFSAGDKILFRGMTRSQYTLPLYGYPADGTFKGKKPVTSKGKHSAEVYADAFIDFLGRRAADAPPFLAYVSFQTPHDPRQSPPAYRAKYKDAELPVPVSYMPVHPFDNGMLRIRDENLAGFPRGKDEVRRHLADYYATIEHTDAQIGRMLAALENRGLSKDSIVVFTSDNGLAVGRHGLMGKQNVYDHSVHVPLIIAGPGVPRGVKRSQPCYIYDIVPTLLKRAGLAKPSGMAFKDLWPVIQDEKATHREHLYFAFMQWQRAVQRGRFKLIEYCVEGRRHTQLFDLEADPHELKNLAGQAAHADTLASLRALLKREAKRLDDGSTGSAFTTAQGKAFWSAYVASEDP